MSEPSLYVDDNRQAWAYSATDDNLVHFGEDLPEKPLALADEQSKQCDLSLCMGTSLCVQPACDLPIANSGSDSFKLVIVNLQKTPLDGKTALRIFARIDHVMAMLMNALGLTVNGWDDFEQAVAKGLPQQETGVEAVPISDDEDEE